MKHESGVFFSGCALEISSRPMDLSLGGKESFLRFSLRVKQPGQKPSADFAPSAQTEDEQLVRRRSAAASHGAAGEIGPLSGRCRAEAVALRGQRRERHPFIGLWIVAFVLGKPVAAPSWIGTSAFAAGVKDEPMIVDHSAAASCRRERCRRFPGIRLWVVDIVQLDYIGVFRRTPA